MKPERQRAPRRVYRVPPPLTRARGQTGLPASEIPGEFPDRTGALLWKSYRTVDLWGLPGADHALFSDGALATRRELIAAAGLDPVLRAPLEVIAELLGNPRVVEVSRIAGACRDVAAWAEERGKLGTALAFAQVGALADAESARAAVLVGRLARMRAEYDRAESWFDHALMLARQNGDRQAYTEALAGMGNLYVQKGNFPKARELHMRCLRAAKRYTLREMQGAALHNLCCVAIECGEIGKVEELAEAALAAFPAASNGLSRLAYDVTYHWALQGNYRRALLVAQEIVPCFTHPADRLLALGLVARTAGGAGEFEVFEDSWAAVWIALSQDHAAAGAASALLGLAYGAVSFGEWARAERALKRALQIATERREEKVVSEVDSLLVRVRNRTGLEHVAAQTPNASERLASRLVETLQAARAAAAQ